MTETILKIEALTKNFDDIENRRTLMREFGDYPEMLFGKNQNGEDTSISINPDNIVIVTYQNNGYIRKNFYDAGGYMTGELYESED